METGFSAFRSQLKNENILELCGIKREALKSVMNPRIKAGACSTHIGRCRPGT